MLPPIAAHRCAMLTLMAIAALGCARSDESAGTGTATAPTSTGAAAVTYGSRQHYARDQVLRFPDFELVYLGERRERSPGLPAITFHDFRLQGAATPATTLSWSSGIGDIGPLPFRVGDRQFLLEMQVSDTLGTLGPDELVVTRAADTR